jgi:signal transduction histidine kinase
MWKDLETIIQKARKESWAKAYTKEDFWQHLSDWVKEEILPDFLTQFSSQVDEIIDIDPDLSEPEIFARVTRYMVEFLGASSASIRLYDPHTEQMLSWGSYPSEEESRVTYIPLEGSVAGEVVKNDRTYLVPNILKEKLYQDKEVIKRKGTNSVMAVPLAITPFSPQERDTVGVIQFYYPEKNRTFTPLEVQMAELMAHRLSFVIARKKILSMHRVNEKKEAIVRNIFLKLGSKGGVKMTEVFNRVVPELVDIINVQSCALFSVTNDMESVVLDAGYPDSLRYHGIGKEFSLHSEPVFEIILNLRDYTGDSKYETVTQSYVLVIDPQRSELVSKNVKESAVERNVNSILYVPLNVGEEITHFMTFDALDQRQRYTGGEIDVFLFLGRELMKAQRMERLDDILHDFKNPAIATAGFARRLKSLFEREGLQRGDPKVEQYLDILLKETSRLQEMALSLYEVGKEQVVDLTRVLRNRFEINTEAIKEQLKQNVDLKEGPYQEPLHVLCYPLHLERILDNLLNNATKAIPIRGGHLSIRTYSQDNWAYAEISNTGIISEEERLRLLEGEGRGRGLYITHRIIRLINGKLEIKVGKNTTTLVVRLPCHEESKDPVPENPASI